MIVRRSAPLLILALGASACASTLRPAAAVVNGVRIGQEKVERALSGRPASPGADQTSAARDVLIQLIQQELVTQEARRRRVMVDAAVVDARLQQLRAGFASEEEFRRAAEQRGFTPESLRRAITDQLLADGLGAAIGGVVSQEDIRTVYRVERTRFEQRRARHLQLKVEDPAKDEQVRERAELLRARIRAGESFARLAGRESDDQQTAPDGGRLGVVTRETPLAPELLNEIFTAAEGEVAGPIRTQFGYHVVLVDDVAVRPLADVEDQIRAELEQRRTQEALDDFLPKAMRAASIVVNPRFGTWDPEAFQIVPYRFYEPALPELDPNAPPGLPPPGGEAIAPSP